ncbi:MAG: YqaE/Pmp3 family membrane protein [Oscillospiraceae bacterium]|nr:YqaE/Pmp3 family membrane protein [Oscillospiraceae bacterium]
MTVSAYRKAAKRLTDRSFIVLNALSFVTLILFSFFPPVAVFFDGALFTFEFMISFVLMMYVWSHMVLTESHPVFFGTKKPSKGISFCNMQCRNAIYQLPAGRETIVRSYIGIERVTSGCIFLSAILFGAVLIVKPAGVIFSAAALIMYIIASIIVLGLSNSLKSCDAQKSSKFINVSYYIALAFIWLYLLLSDMLDDTMEAGFIQSPVPSVIFGSLCIILGISDFIIESSIHKKLIADCPNRSLSGEPV